MAQTDDLKQAGLKSTLPRIKILTLLESNRQRHLSAEDVYKIMLEKEENIGLATIYRVLTQFESADLVQRHHFESGHAVFELKDNAHHDHIVCIQCGNIVEFLDESIEERQKAVSKKLGFEINEHSLTIYGKCIKKDCPNLL